MKQFFKMMFASALGAILAAGLLITLSIFLLIGISASMSQPTAFSPSSNSVLKIELNGALSDQKTDNPYAMLLGEEDTELSLTDILKAIKEAKNSDNIKGIYIEAGNFSAGSSSIDAIRRAITDFKESGKFVVAYGDQYTQGSYYLASVADKVYINPQGALLLTGMSSQTMFYKGLLNKLGVEMLIFKVGTYKGAVEPFMLDKLSDANREQISSYMNGIWDNITADIAKSRKITVEDVNHYADQGFAIALPEKALECGLVDELKYKPEAEEYVKDLAGQTDKKLKTVGVDKVRNIKSKEGKSKNKIAVLYAEGEITEAVTSPYSMDKSITEKVAKELIKLKEDESIKAVVLRVNSPGGSAFTSEQIWKQVLELKKVKPIVVSMGDVAASGGYYISCAANKIVAEPNTLTGSIGIFGMFPNMTGLFNKVALTTDVVKTNTYADLGDVSRPMREDEKALIQSRIESGYDTFITRCADGRGMTKAAIDSIGQGRVWTGEQAIEKGLVDELGGIEKAIAVAAKLADLKDYKLVEVSGSKDFLKDLFEKQLDEVKLNVVKQLMGEDFEYFKTLNLIKSAPAIQTRLPYDVQPL
ncbi:signal peptide peptidase SppA [Macellibacteroides fermentans]|jgi:protease-4|uniref:signal peptide peptidase SppA n=1 Tax=Macellibacteroides fermentans TaxID=879969 RepID=UPI002B3B8AE6|nr:signal peptide peptidase SppA [Macellibacteroides fermentans]